MAADSCVWKGYAKISPALCTRPGPSGAMPRSVTYQFLPWEQITSSCPAPSPGCAESLFGGRGRVASEGVLVPGCPGTSENLCLLSSTLSGFKSFSLTSVELQMLTNSCVKLQTVHSIPLTINKEGGPFCRGPRPFLLLVCPWDRGFPFQRNVCAAQGPWPLPGVNGAGQELSLPRQPLLGD